MNAGRPGTMVLGAIAGALVAFSAVWPYSRPEMLITESPFLSYVVPAVVAGILLGASVSIVLNAQFSGVVSTRVLSTVIWGFVFWYLDFPLDIIVSYVSPSVVVFLPLLGLAYWGMLFFCCLGIRRKIARRFCTGHLFAMAMASVLLAGWILPLYSFGIKPWPEATSLFVIKCVGFVAVSAILSDAIASSSVVANRRNGFSDCQ